MTASTCRDCAVRSQLEGIENLVRRALRKIIRQEDLELAHKLVQESVGLLGTVIAIKKEL